MFPKSQKLRRAVSSWCSHGGVGVYAMFDGQFGSTGKGLLASLLGAVGDFDVVTNNAGPNSGHTAYRRNTYHKDEKVVLKQLTMGGVFARRAFHYLNAGAIIDVEGLHKEVATYAKGKRVVVHPRAAIVPEVHGESDLTRAIGSTGKGTGAALARKIGRMSGKATAGECRWAFRGSPILVDAINTWNINRVLMEVSQGHSLGLNSRFYPYVTSRECSVSQGLADLGAPPSALKMSIMTLRTFPIRVANPVDGTSGGCYPDQEEITFEDIGQKQELSTVTMRPRRIFTWSRIQYREALIANAPDSLFINFMNYLPKEKSGSFVTRLIEDYVFIFKRPPKMVLLGWGPKMDDVEVYR